MIGLRFKEFKNKLVEVTYKSIDSYTTQEVCRKITGDLIFEDTKIIKIQTLSQQIAIGIDSIVTLQLARRRETYG